MDQNQSPRYWQSLEEWRRDPEFQKLVESEFRSSPLRSSDGEGGTARRDFLKLMGASLALTSFGCVRRPAQKIVPYVNKPSEIVEGIANYYASTFVDGGEGFGVVVVTREGRPIRVEGNEFHPTNRGGMSARAHAHILDLYDPARATTPLRNLLNEGKTNRDTISTNYEKADAEIVAALKKGKVALLTGSIVSPTTKALIEEMRRAFGARHYVWDAHSHEAYVDGQERAFGDRVAPRLRLENARLIVALNSDILGTFLQPTEQSRGFAQGRKPGPEMNRLIAFESLMSLTGANADERHRIRPSDTKTVAMGLLHELLIKKRVSSYASDSAISNIVREYADAAERLGIGSDVLEKLADELWTHRGQSLVVAGDDLAAQVAVNLLNAVLGNDGRTIDYQRSPNLGFQGRTSDLAALTQALQKGDVETLIIHGVNPVYAAPTGVNFVEALRKTKLAVYTGSRNDETGRNCDFVLPDHHPMEGWGDAEVQKGVYSLQQPTIRPLHQSRAFQDGILSWLRSAEKGGLARYESYYEYLKTYWMSTLGADWMKALEEGVLVKGNRDGSDSARRFRSSALAIAAMKETPKADVEAVLYTTVGLKDGSLSNISWLQEFPDPVTKICWDNYVTVSPALAGRHHISEGQHVTVTVGDRSLTLPAHIQPGQDDRCVGVALGYGREFAGDIGNNVGQNAFALAGYGEDGLKFSGLNATVAVLRSRTELASVQGHHSMEGRQIVVEATLAQYRENPEANIHRHKVFSAWSGHKYEGHKWGMSIDLNTCTGCSACVIACQSENNIPTVGKRYVLEGREMHWIRIDRYYVGTPESPDTVFMPLTCHHCDNAPCETVCPVAATVHSDEGTNDMVYNRCVGTRYCANNCPYKVRRFNWFNYARMAPNLHSSPTHMQLNPEVTVRSRGVMEKCSFCIHRIQQAKTAAKLADRPLKDGDVKTACQSSCPTGSIVFGDLNDKESRVAKLLAEEKRHYSLLEELNTRPALQYMSKIRNTETLKGGGHHAAKGGH